MPDVPHDGPLDDVDDQLLTELADLFSTLDPMPATLAEDSRIAITVAALDAEVATLTSGQSAALRRTDETTDEWSFEFDDVRLLLRASGDPTARTVTVDGWVTVPDVQVEAHVGDIIRTTQADTHGRFVITAVPRGRAWFVIVQVEGRPLATPPITL